MTLAKSSFRFWACVGIALTALCTTLLVLPTLWQQARLTSQIREFGTEVQGTVIGHGVTRYVKPCQTTFVDVRYLVNAVSFTIRVHGCGATPKSLPLGTSVPVRYLKSSPAAAIAQYKNVSSDSPSWLSVGLWLMVLAFCCASPFMCLEHRKIP